MLKQQELFPQMPDREKFPTNISTNRFPLHRWFNFIAGFSPDFVSWCIQEAKLSANDDVVVDPFAGLSTTLVQASFHGLQSVGFETHPFFYDISRAKLSPPLQKQHVKSLQDSIQTAIKPYTGNLKNIWTDDAEAFLVKLVPELELRFLASALLFEGEIELSMRPLYRLIVSRVLELAARSQTDGIYKAPTSEKISMSHQIALERVCEDLLEDIPMINDLFSGRATIYPMSSERMSPLQDGSCSLCVTSPPYLNNFDFAEMTRMELYYWRYAGSWREITERVRRHLIVNTTTVPADLKHAQSRFSETLSEDLCSRLDVIVQALSEQRLLRKGKKDYYLLVYPYFSQMQSVIREVHRVLKPKSSFHLVVADAALYGIHISTEQFLAKIMEENGFEIQNIERLRDRGNRWILQKRQGINKPLGEFHIHARRA